jgi:hypothetical protein
MRQSQTYRRSKQKGMQIDPDAFYTYRTGVALRIQRKTKGKIRGIDAWQLSAIPAFILWAFRKPRAYFKRKKVDRRLRKKLAESNSNS